MDRAVAPTTDPAVRQRRRTLPPPAPPKQRFGALAIDLVALPLLVLVAPFALPAVVVVDLVTLRLRLPTPRLYALLIVFLCLEWVGQSKAAVIWLRGRLGADTYDDNRRVQGWWAGALIRWADRLLGLRLDLPDLDTIPDGDVIVLSRHSSMLDAIVPAWIFPGPLDRPVHYVLKRELLWVANIQVFGRRLRNHFVRRGGPDTAAEIAAITAMAEAAEPDAGFVIFPEGTYGSAANIARIRASLERRDDTDTLALANELEATLPPKAAGSLALMAARPEAPIMILGHVGLEPLADLKGLRRSLPTRDPVVVRWWIHDAADLPTDDIGRTAWVEDRWRELDRWVTATRDDLRTGRHPGSSTELRD
ncbi:MAG: 1-acyl-sn-glycerol-3-phosphate acyltransferase [Acidimicrobiales bacterium]